MKNPNLNEKIQSLLISSIKGEAIGIFKERLLDLARNSKKSAYKLFSHIDLNHSQDQKIFKNILEILEPNKTKAAQLFQEYHSWCDHLHISKNLINYLEFLASKEFYRFHPYIKLIHELKPYESSWLYYVFGTLLTGLFGLIITFLDQPKLWYAFQHFMQDNAPAILKFLLDYILLAENLALISLFFKIIKFITTFYFILKDHAATEESKIIAIIKLTINSSIVITAQLVCFLGLASLGGYLFVAASLFDVIWSAFTYFNLKKPIRPLDYEPKTLEEKSLYCAQLAKYYEENAHYNQQMKASIYEFIAFCFITTATIVAIVFFPELSILCVVFQFLCSWLKDMMIEYTKKQSNIYLHQQIENIYQQHESVDPVTHLSALKIQTLYLEHRIAKNRRLEEDRKVEPEAPFASPACP